MCRQNKYGNEKMAFLQKSEFLIKFEKTAQNKRHFYGESIWKF